MKCRGHVLRLLQPSLVPTRAQLRISAPCTGGGPEAFGKWTVTHDPKSEGGGESASWKRSSVDPGREGMEQVGISSSTVGCGRAGEDSMVVHLGDFVDMGNGAVTFSLSSTLP